MTGPLVILAVLRVIAGWGFIAEWSSATLP